MSEEYKEKSIEEIVELLNEEIGYTDCDYEKVDSLLDCLKLKSKEIERLHSIIKEAREYINEDKNCVPKHIKEYFKDLLDKVGDNNVKD